MPWRLFALVAALALPTAAAWVVPEWALLAEGRAESPAVACALRDADADGHPDLLLHSRAADGRTVLRALAGPRFDRVLWESAHGARSQLFCGADVEGDGIADPILKELDERSTLPSEAPATASEAAARILAIRGATGEALLELARPESERTAGSSASASMRTALSPAGPRLLMHVARNETLVGAALPLAGQALTMGRATATVELLAPDGSVVGRIEPQGAEAELLSLAAVPDADATRVLVLSSVDASPFDEAARRIPTASAYDAAGRLLWSRELPASGGRPLLLPQAGDINGDGVVDLVVETVPTAVAARASVVVLSGADGAELFADPVDAGLVMALPLGDAPGALGDALLVVRQLADGAPLVLERVVDGKVTWSVEVDAAAVPVNLARDVFTGDATGFTDLTGDGLPDVALLVQVGSVARLEIVLGRDGSRGWSRPVPPDAVVVPVRGRDGSDDLLVVDRDDGSLGLERVDGGTGDTQWSADGEVPGDDGMDVATAPLVGDETDDLVLSRGGGGAGAHDATAPDEDDTKPGVYVLDGSTGQTRWTGATDEGDPPPAPLDAEAGPAADIDPPRAGVPPAAVAIAVTASVGAVAGTFLLRRFLAP